MTFSNPEICSCKPSIKVVNLSAWELNCSGQVLVVYSSGVKGDAVSVCLEVVWIAEPWLEGEAWGVDSLFGIFEEWLIWRDAMDNGHWRTSIFPSLGGRTPSSTMIFMRRLQKGRHVCAAIHAAFFPIVWKYEHKYQPKLLWWDHIRTVLFQDW